jgi:hypothetical protein
MTIKLLKDCPHYGAKWTKGRIIQDVYPPDGRRMVDDGEAEEYSANVLVQKAAKAAKHETPATKPTE